MTTLTAKHLTGPVLHPGHTPTDSVFRTDASLMTLLTTLLFWALIALAVLVDLQL